ncbi:MAG: DUF4160 domain-containing protein [Bacteroidetes bacterium]|nr:DUF4160 domain-containing protein [Bacteroidota bacterium]
MPTILKIGPYRFFFYANDKNEPCHIHIEREDKIAKFWLEPGRLEYSGGFNRKEIKRIQDIVEKQQKKLIEKWYEYFSD